VSSLHVSELSLPHQREVLGLVEMVKDACLAEKGKGQMLLILTDSMQHARWLIQRVHDSVRWMGDEQKAGIKVHREGIEITNGSKIVFSTYSDPGRLMGMRPDEIYLFGQTGELFYWMQHIGCEVVPVA